MNKRLISTVRPSLSISAFVFGALVSAVCLSSCTKGSTSLETDSQKSSYALGQNVGIGLKSQQISIDGKAFMAGLNDALDAKESRLTPEQLRETLVKMQKESLSRVMTDDAKKKTASAEDNKRLGEAYLAENRKKQGVQVSASGLQSEILSAGQGSHPRESEKVVVHYTGSLIDGTVFESTRERGKPSELKVNDGVPGWVEALKSMKKGGRARFVIPSSLAYKESGVGPIGPNATLIFDVELLEIKK